MLEIHIICDIRSRRGHTALCDGRLRSGSDAVGSIVLRHRGKVEEVGDPRGVHQVVEAVVLEVGGEGVGGGAAVGTVEGAVKYTKSC